MGLPIWKDPDEERQKKEATRTDPTAAARSPIRRRPSVHGRRNSRLPRDPSLIPSRSNPSPPPASGYSGLRSPRRGNGRGVPPVSTLLESADRRSAIPPPPPRTQAPNDYGLPVSSPTRQRGRELTEALDILSGGPDNAARMHFYLSPRGGPPMSPPPRDHTRAEQDGYLTAPRARFLTRENTPFHRSPEPMSATDRSESRNGVRAGRSNLPTPPAEHSEESDSLFVPERHDPRRPRAIRSTHPLSNSWQPESPIGGLGDRNRSPTPADGWEIMQTTITPDVALPSADSSFTSTAASQSFGSNETSITEPDREPREGRRDDLNFDSDSESEHDDHDEVDAMMRDIDEREATAQYAKDMYLVELQTREGQSRIERHQRAHATEGNKFALANENWEIEVGFRLIDEALRSQEGRQRVFEISRQRPQESNSFEDWIFSIRRGADQRRRRARSPDEEPPCPQPEARSTSQEAAQEANAQVHNYFRRFTADSLADAHRNSRRTSPPPQYEPPRSPPTIETFISRDPPEPHPVSPPSARTQTEVGDLLLSGDETDLNAIRRVVERLAQRDDVPDEWWMSMGLNLSRTRVPTRSRSRSRSRSPHGSRRVSAMRTGDDMRIGRTYREQRRSNNSGGGARL